MDMDLKRTLIQKLDEIAPEYGLVELSYPSFMRCYGFHTQPLSAADAVEGISALLDVAEGIRIEVEIEGTRNGGEWFGAGRVWEAYAMEKNNTTKSDLGLAKGDGQTAADNIQESQPSENQSQEPDWWVKNFWTAYDALSE
jgi:cell division control protein 45